MTLVIRWRNFVLYKGMDNIFIAIFLNSGFTRSSGNLNDI